MNRLVALLLFCLYLPASFNATVTVHYCMGKMTGVDILTPASGRNSCPKCGMLKKDKKGCCRDKHETLKLNKDQLSSPQTIIAAPFISSLQTGYIPVRQTLLAGNANSFSVAHSPPLISVSPLLLYCVFRV